MKKQNVRTRASNLLLMTKNEQYFNDIKYGGNVKTFRIFPDEFTS